MTAPLLDWPRRSNCVGCGRFRDSFACSDGLRCRSCLPKDWTPPPVAQWLAQFGELLRVHEPTDAKRVRLTERVPVDVSEDDKMETDDSRFIQQQIRART